MASAYKYYRKESLDIMTKAKGKTDGSKSTEVKRGSSNAKATEVKRGSSNAKATDVKKVDKGSEGSGVEEQKPVDAITETPDRQDDTQGGKEKASEGEKDLFGNDTDDGVEGDGGLEAITFLEAINLVNDEVVNLRQLCLEQENRLAHLESLALPSTKSDGTLCGNVDDLRY